MDPSPNRQPLPSWLKKVPTLVIAGEQEPRTDSDVMNWLYERKMKEGGGGGGARGPVPAGAAGGPAAAGDVDAFNMAEQTSFAKGFSYSGIDTDTSTVGSGGMSMPGTFSFLGGAASEGDRLSQGGGAAAAAPPTSNRRSKKEELFDRQMEEYQRERNQGMPNMPSRQGGGFQ